MIRIIVTTVDANTAAHMGGPVTVSHRTFDVEAPQLEAFMAEAKTWTGSAAALCQRTIAGVEVLSDSDGSPKGGDSETGSVRRTTARAEGIARNEAGDPQ